MIRLKIGIFSAGKTTSGLKEVSRVADRGMRILWLTPLKSDARRISMELVRKYNIDPDKVYLIPSKIDVCPVLRQIKNIYHALIGIAFCKACKNRMCLFKTFIKSAMDKSNEGIFIATHKFLWLALFFPLVYIDEYDFLIPSSHELIPASKVHKVLEAIKKVFGERIVKELKRKYLARVSEQYYVFKTIFPIRYFYRAREWVGLSATIPRNDILALLLGFDTCEDLDWAMYNDEIDIYIQNLPTPKKRDYFNILNYRLYWTSPHRFYFYAGMKRRIKDDLKKGYTITIIARSNKEARVLYSSLHRDGIKDVLVEGINWDLSNYNDWNNHAVRVLVIRGKFHRCLNIESDKIYAFYQHLLPDERQKIESKLYPLFLDHAEEIIKFDEYRAHVQTIFRCARSWTRRHDFYLLDNKYWNSLKYFDHVWDFAKRRITFISSL